MNKQGTPTSLANGHPVNQHALKLLRQAGEQPCQDVDLGLSALMRWGLDKGGLQEPREADRDAFREWVENLNWGDPTSAMRLLLEHAIIRRGRRRRAARPLQNLHQ